ncbi:acetyl/propionyl/methylcrotonyl-CoA carboxylase subunit alpha [Ancrocorticia populi]|uniref:biotin carboxylase n=1 Tax=Ancrocorticia populi TaxID=2175228 RepID=A0A2V1KBA1_9ACTO|nr:biotin carboxylase N-terminal domain-containing protein [Ancrocorticia populi]PWF27580.1 carboxylate--amine ligase [Ancrocorticia populi]
MISRILVANRSEIALRVIRTARDMGIESVAIYTDSDINAQFVAQADEAYALGSDYMDIDRIVTIAKEAGVDAVHPGYGFLSEIEEFAAAIIDAGIAWIGPDPTVLARLGDKIQARRLAESVGVSPVPGISDPVSGREVVEDFVASHGFPIVTKKADGGGGRGITVIDSDADIAHFFAAHGGEADKFFVERFIRTARHVETQCERDSAGNFAVVSTRDCSVQRRNQKLIEEAPAPQLPGDSDATIRDWSKRLFDAVGYVGLGTCEFLVEPDGRVNFLEVNPRLQVEHTVSEEVTGLDLVREQITIAGGGVLSPVPAARAHSFEFRITCEDPANGMIPSTGTISRLRWPLGHGVRIESGIVQGDVVTNGFDPMLAKLIVTAPDREQAIARSRRALEEMLVEGLATPAALYSDVISMDDFAGAPISTRWFEDSVLPEKVSEEGAAGAGGTANGSHAAMPATPEERISFVAELNGQRMNVTIPRDVLVPNGPRTNSRGHQPLRGGVRRAATAAGGEQVDSKGMVNSQIQAIVVRVCVEKGTEVQQGDLLVVLESMKMESYVYAPYDGTVTEIAVEGGENVAAFQPLVRVDRKED